MVTYSADRMYGARDAFSSPATFLHSRKPQVLSLLNLQTLRIDFGNFSGPPQFGFRSKPHTVHAYNPSIVAAPSGLCRRCALVAAIRADVLGQCDSGSLLYDERTFAEFDPEAFFKNTAIAVLDVKLRVIAWTWLISRPKRQVRASLPKGDRSRVAPGAADGYAPPWSNQVFDTRLLNYNGRLLATYVCHACDFSISTVEVTGVETPDGGLGQLRSWASGRLKVHPQWVQGRNQALFVRHDADGGSRLLVQPWIGMVASFGKLKLVTRKLGRPCYLAGAPAAKEDERWYCGTSAPGASTEVHQIKRGFTRHPELLVNQTAALRLRAGLQTRFSPTSNLALVRSGSCAGYLGVAHMHRSNNPVTQAETDTRPLWQRRFSLPRARRRALERVWYEVREGVRRDNHTFKFGSQYTHFWYVLAPEPPHRLLGWSREFCLQSQQDAADCESIQFVSSIQTAPGDTLRVAYGVNDCETKVGVLPLQQVWSSLRPVPADPECEEREGRDGQCCAPGATRIDCFGRTTLSNACDLARLLQPSPLLSLRGGEAKSSDLLAQLSAVKPSLPKLDLSKCVDSILAGIGLAGSCALIGVLEPRLGKKLFVPPMMASGIIFFSPQAPPSPKGLISGTIGSGSVSAAMLALLKKVDASQTACFGAAAGALLVWYKATGCIFPPAAVVCVLMAGTPWGPTQGGAAG